jgi:hypothetical protein
MVRAACTALLYLVAFGWLVPPAASADISIEEARKIAEGCAGHSLADARVELGGAESPWRVSFLQDVGPDCPACWAVDTRRGCLSDYWQIPQPVTGAEPITDEQALGLAREEAARVLGPEGTGLVWSVRSSGTETIELGGAGPPTGDPPRAGTAPECSVSIMRASGKVRRLFASRPDDATPLPVSVTKEQAVEAARDEFVRETKLDRNTVPAKEPSLAQERGRVWWSVEFAYGPQDLAARWSCRVDAQTGALIDTDSPAGVPPPGLPARRAASAPSARPPFWPYLAGAGVLVALAGIVVVARRRRK